MGVVGRDAVHHRGIVLFRPTFDLAAKIIGAMLRAAGAEGGGAGLGDHPPQVDRLVGDAPAGGGRDLHEAGGAEIGEGGMGGIEIFDLCHLNLVRLGEGMRAVQT